MDTKTKKCTKCKQIKPRSEFYIRDNNPNWITSECKDCTCKNRKIRLEKQKGRKLGKRAPFYTEQDSKDLKDLYESGASYTEIQLQFPTRTRHALESKLSEMQISSRVAYFRKRVSSIEYLIKTWLDDLSIQYEFQARLGTVVVDFLIKNLIIEVNGSYWHCDPLEYPNGAQYELQTKNIEKDKIKRQYLVDLGYKIVYIWEHDLEQNLDLIHKLFIAVLNSNTEDNDWPKTVELLRDNTVLNSVITQGTESV